MFDDSLSDIIAAASAGSPFQTIFVISLITALLLRKLRALNKALQSRPADALEVYGNAGRSPSKRALKPEEIVFGGIWIGPGGGVHGDGERPDPAQANADATVSAAVAAGVHEFDTAPWYGAGGSEQRLGLALQRLVEARGLASAQALKVGTKVGRLFMEPDDSPALFHFEAKGRPTLTEVVRRRRCVNDYSGAGAARSLAESLDRLRLKAVHTLRIHDPNDNSNNKVGCTPFTDEVEIAVSEGGMMQALRRMRAEGTIAHVGLGMNCNLEAHQGVPDEVLRLIRSCEVGTFDSALLAGGWNLLCQTGLPCLIECQRRGVEVRGDARAAQPLCLPAA